MSEGWVCPVCGRGLSPQTTECPCYKEHQNVITTTDTMLKPNVSTVTVSTFPEKSTTNKIFKGMFWHL